MFGFLHESNVDKNKQVPKDIVKEEGKHATYETIYGVEAGSSFMNKFEYVEKFEKIENGVRFNVETLPKPLKKHLSKEKKSRNDLFRACKHHAASYYTKEYNDEKTSYQNRVDYRTNDMRLEAVYEENDNLVYTRPDAFLVCCVTAFAQHLPLALSPDHIWTLISYAFQKHVNNNSEKLRKKFVSHEGKERLLVVTPNANIFAMSKPDLPDTGATPSQWENIVFGEFSKQISEHTGDKLRELVAGELSTTSPAAKACCEISLMSATKDYFSFGMMTCGCGIPEVTLLGTEDDWVAIRERAEGLGEYMTDEFSKKWLPHLLPVLDNFVQSYRGNVHHGFWQSMVKFRAVPGGSGMPMGGISGWVQLFYPIMEKGRENQYLRPWNHMYYSGHASSDFPSVVSSAPVDWKYVEEVFNITFHAGFTGFSQDNDGRLSPNIGWYVTHAPTPPPGKHLNMIQDELLALLKNQAAKKTPIDKKSPLYQRVEHLLKEEAKALKNPKLEKHEVAKANQNMKTRKKKYKF